MRSNWVNNNVYGELEEGMEGVFVVLPKYVIMQIS